MVGSKIGKKQKPRYSGDSHTKVILLACKTLNLVVQAYKNLLIPQKACPKFLKGIKLDYQGETLGIASSEVLLPGVPNKL